jgi:hypothetical protein
VFNGDVEVIVKGAITDNVKAFSTGKFGNELSVARTVKFVTPAVVGVPLICPPGDNDNPAGNAETSVHVYGDVPPDAFRV